ncbi:MAG: universal stress protein [Chloroflexi bacterium]|nr:universal stress protein [Chloroflexota bacterium]
MYRKILVPLDGSELAASVLPYAVAIAARFNSELVLLRVVSTSPRDLGIAAVGAGDLGMAPQIHARSVEQVLDEEMKQAKQYLLGVREKLGEYSLHMPAEIRQGEPAREILECARERSVDLIAIATHGRSGLGKLVFGSVADRVLREAGIPILLIKP